MKKEYNFSKGKRGAVVPQVGKTRITIYLDDGILERFKTQSQRTGKGYQTLINDALNSYLGLTAKPLTEEMVRKIVREELSGRNSTLKKANPCSRARPSVASPGT